MKRLIAPAVAVTAALALATPASAATLTPQAPDQNGWVGCRYSLTGPEREAALKAEAVAKTLNGGMYDAALAESFEVAYPGIKAAGDAYLNDAAVRQFLRDDRTLPLGARSGSKSSAATIAGKDRARGAAVVKLRAAGMHEAHAQSYLDAKQGMLIPDQAYQQLPAWQAELVIGLDGNVKALSKIHPSHVIGNIGESTASYLALQDPQRQAFVNHFNSTYYGRSINEIEKGYVRVIMEQGYCYEGPRQVALPTQVNLPAPQTIEPADLSGPGTPAPAGSSSIFAPIIAALNSLFAGIEALIPGLKLPRF